MKKVICLFLIYEITDEPILPSVIDQKIGRVTRYSDHEGTYRGNYLIKGIMRMMRLKPNIVFGLM